MEECQNCVPFLGHACSVPTDTVKVRCVAAAQLVLLLSCPYSASSGHSWCLCMGGPQFSSLPVLTQNSIFITHSGSKLCTCPRSTVLVFCLRSFVCQNKCETATVQMPSSAEGTACRFFELPFFFAIFMFHSHRFLFLADRNRFL